MKKSSAVQRARQVLSRARHALSVLAHAEGKRSAAVVRAGAWSRRRPTRTLLSYIAEPVVWAPHDVRLAGHSNKWESREIARLIARRGHEVVAIDWNDTETSPAGSFEYILDIHRNLPRLARRFPNARKLLHLTGSYNPFQHEAEMARITAFESRRGVKYTPKRHVADLDLYLESLRMADLCSLVGNNCTLSTYPPELHHKIRSVTVSASWPLPVKRLGEFVPAQREFIWFAGAGCILKGLDLVIEAFASTPSLTLHIVGNTDEGEILDSYRNELSLPHIHCHGFLDTTGEEFKNIISRCFAFVAPSASEGISPAAASCMLIGLYPIVSRNTGITLPENAGRYLGKCSVEEIRETIMSVHGQKSDDLNEDILKTQAEAARRYSRKAFSRCMDAYLDLALSFGGGSG